MDLDLMIVTVQSTVQEENLLHITITENNNPLYAIPPIPIPDVIINKLLLKIHHVQLPQDRLTEKIEIIVLNTLLHPILLLLLPIDLHHIFLNGNLDHQFHVRHLLLVIPTLMTITILY